MANAWLSHVKVTMKVNPGKSFKEILKLAKKSYKSVGTTVAKKTRKVGRKLIGKKAKKGGKSKKTKTKSKKSRKSRGRK